MQEASEASEGGMAAIIGGEEDRVRELAAVADVDVANINAPGQIVLSGESSKIILAVSLAKEYSARKAVELTVAGAFHSRLMEPALSDALGRSCRNTHEFAPSACGMQRGCLLCKRARYHSPHAGRPGYRHCLLVAERGISH